MVLPRTVEKIRPTRGDWAIAKALQQKEIAEGGVQTGDVAGKRKGERA
jgi:hypothetical protein